MLKQKELGCHLTPVHHLSIQSCTKMNQSILKQRNRKRRVKSYIRWNAMAMVVRANTSTPGIGGHISTYASAATLYEVAFNHFFKGPKHKNGSDLIFYQGHGSPGIYARSFRGRFTKEI